ncbi:MAG: hypothetical protein EOM20_11885, partial [Spartobacteria bacterium]|nr:hypothetical protein [Spartobacteria bacterium]
MKNIRCSNIPADRRTARSTVAAPTAPAIFALLIAFVGLGLVPAVPAADVPAAINYQGRLTDSEGHPVTGGYYHIEFRLWDNATASGAGNLVWGRMFPLRVADGGTFNVLLSDDGGELKNPTPLTNDLRDAFGDADRYLGITVTRTADGDVLNPAEIAPRQRLVSVPYAFHAQYTEHALRADNALSASNAHHALNSDQLNGLSSTGYLHTARLPGAQSPAVMIQWDGAQASA